MDETYQTIPRKKAMRFQAGCAVILTKSNRRVTNLFPEVSVKTLPQAGEIGRSWLSHLPMFGIRRPTYPGSYNAERLPQGWAGLRHLSQKTAPYPIKGYQRTVQTGKIWSLKAKKGSPPGAFCAIVVITRSEVVHCSGRRSKHLSFERE